MKYLCLKSVTNAQIKGKTYSVIGFRNEDDTIIIEAENKYKQSIYYIGEHTAFYKYFKFINRFIPISYYTLKNLFKN